MPKLVKTLICPRKKSNICCNICGKKYDGERGLKLHFKYSHNLILEDEYIKKQNENGAIFYKCLICSKNAMNCNCSVSRLLT